MFGQTPESVSAIVLVVCPATPVANWIRIVQAYRVGVSVSLELQ